MPYPYGQICLTILMLWTLIAILGIIKYDPETAPKWAYLAITTWCYAWVLALVVSMLAVIWT